MSAAWPAERIARLIRMKREGLTEGEIAAELGVNTRALRKRWTVIRRAIKAKGIDMPTVKPPGRPPGLPMSAVRAAEMERFAIEAREMIDAGATWSEIAAKFGIARDTARLRGQRAGIFSKHLGRRADVWTPARITAARNLLAEGWSAAQVARAGGLKPETLRMALRRYEQRTGA